MWFPNLSDFEIEMIKLAALVAMFVIHVGILKIRKWWQNVQLRNKR